RRRARRLRRRRRRLGGRLLRQVCLAATEIGKLGKTPEPTGRHRARARGSEKWIFGVRRIQRKVRGRKPGRRVRLLRRRIVRRNRKRVDRETFGLEIVHRVSAPPPPKEGQVARL